VSSRGTPEEWAEAKTQRLIKAAQKKDKDGSRLLDEIAKLNAELGELDDDQAGPYMACLLLALTAVAAGQFEIESD
jgi:hypothetical protein